MYLIFDKHLFLENVQHIEWSYFFRLRIIDIIWLLNPTWEGVQIRWIGGGGAKSASPP